MGNWGLVKVDELWWEGKPKAQAQKGPDTLAFHEASKVLEKLKKIKNS